MKQTNNREMRDTEKNSNYENLEKMDTATLVESINREDKKIADCVAEKQDQIIKLIDHVFEKFSQGGRLFYIGAGTSGRLGILDASEIPPTFGMPHERVVGLIAGGDKAIRKAVEFAEDDTNLAQKDLEAWGITSNDAVIGIAASGTTPYVLGGVAFANTLGCVTGCITNSSRSPLANAVQCPVEVIVGPEFVTGSTRMKSGTAQKMVLNIISTTLMIKIGRVKGNKMVNMQLNNDKLVDRGIRFILQETSLSYEEAAELLKKLGSVDAVLQFTSRT